ncbi:tip elongation aberrant protein 1 [Plakobranchus ocellatus]|uniref:Tip elongation aberrant protein 1 n=1 Tax=Plakobranchus ocellatus TaxID=259542 RepID=A0AAV4DQP0_9GAST|nr:tip elongation aberrant protein 1 [Plakobranchus ocellatus]
MRIVHSESGSALSFHWSVLDAANTVQTPTCSKIFTTSDAGADSRGHHGDLRQGKANQPPRNRYHHAACCVGNYVYVFGGKDRYSPLRDLWRLDVATGQWESHASWAVELPHLQGHTMTAYRSQILVFGGTFCESVLEETPLWTINTDLQCVRKYRPDSPSCLRPTGRREHSCVIYRKSLYVYGGFLDSSGSTDEFWAFNIEEEQWRAMRRRKPGKRHGHVAVVKGSHMWLHGGMKGLKCLSDLWIFNFSLCTWDCVKSVGVSPSLSNHTAHLVANSLLLFGGSCPARLSNDVWIFQFDTVSWRHVTVQHGDSCPPVSLHASVILGQSPQGGTDSSTADRTRSVPQLKQHSNVSQAAQLPVRPWTSPSQNMAFVQSDLPLLGPGKTGDILQLENLHTPRTMLIDKNNNASEEDLTSERETSFFVSVENSCASSECKSSLTRPMVSRNVDCSHSRSNKSTAHHSNRGKMRPASEEVCTDGLPLLKRFQSINSDTDLGHNNLTLTLSDEQVCGHVTTSSQFSMKPQHQSSQTNLTAFGNSCVTKSTAFTTGRSCNFDNPLYSATIATSDAVDSEPTDSSLSALFFPYHSKRSASYSNIYEPENVTPKQGDMILEDIEGFDITGMFHGVDIAPPSTLSISLDELNNKAGFRNLMKNSFKELKKAQYSSYDNVSSYTAMKGCLKNSSAYNIRNMNSAPQHCTSGATQTSNEAVIGRYCKNSTSTTNNRLANILKHRNKYFSSSQLDDLVATNSVSTQTTGSQLCLHSKQPSEENKTSCSSRSPSAQTTSSQNLMDQHKTVQPEVKSQSIEGIEESRNVNLPNGQLCLLVIGGQTESPSFTAEPLKLWRCRLS